MNSKEIHHTDQDDVSRAEQLLGADLDRPYARDDRGGIVAERTQGVGRGRDADRAVGAGPDDPQLGPREQECRQPPERLAYEHIHAARARKRGGQLRVGERTAKHDDTTHDPGEQKQRHVVDTLRDAGRRTEDAAADRRADEDRNRAPQTEPANQPLAPAVGGQGSQIIP